MSALPDISQTDVLTQHIHAMQPHLPGTALDWLSAYRAEAVERFRQNGLPSRDHEAWRYVPVNTLLDSLLLPVTPSPAMVDESTIRSATIPDLPVTQLVFAGGRFVPSLSDSIPKTKGITLLPLSTAAESHPELLKDALNRPMMEEADAFATLNSALWSDGVLLSLAPGTILDKPIHIITVGSKASASHLRFLVHAGQDSQAMIISSHISPDGTLLYNGVSHMTLERGAHISELRWQRESQQAHHVHHTLVTATEHSTYRNMTLSTGAAVARQHLHTLTKGEGAAITLNGAFIAQDKQVLDHYLPVEHASPDTQSSQFYKGVVGGNAKSNFFGRIIVPPEATNTEAHQQFRGLLLSERAQCNARPELEIHTDEVQCSHGVAIGDIDTEALYYMQARGIEEAQARQLLVGGFLDEVLERADIPALRTHLQEQVHRILEKE